MTLYGSYENDQYIEKRIISSLDGSWYFCG